MKTYAKTPEPHREPMQARTAATGREAAQQALREYKSGAIQLRRMSEPLPPVSEGLVQLQAEDEWEDALPGAALIPEEEELLQASAMQPVSQRPPAPDAPRAVSGAGRAGSGAGLPETLQANMEDLSGFSMDDVTVHYNSPEPARIQAHAYTRGTDIHVAPGQEKHLPHEAWHVVQQKQGRVEATAQLKSGLAVNDDPALEREADVMGGKDLREIPGGFSRPKRKQNSPTGVVIQCGPPNMGILMSFLRRWWPELSTGLLAGGTDLPLHPITLMSSLGERLGGKVGSALGQKLFVDNDGVENITGSKTMEALAQLGGKGLGFASPVAFLPTATQIHKLLPLSQSIRSVGTNLLKPGSYLSSLLTLAPKPLVSFGSSMLRLGSYLPGVFTQMLKPTGLMAAFGTSTFKFLGTLLWNTLPGFSDADKRQEINDRYGIEVAETISGKMLNDIFKTLQIVPPIPRRALSTITDQGNDMGQASYYDGRRTINIGKPFGMPYTLYTYLDKSSPWQRTLMDMGTLQGLPELSGQDDDSFIHRTDGGPSERHIMAGVSDVNSRERLATWTLRHEMGHAADKSIGWSSGRKWREYRFGRWERYENEGEAYRDYSIIGQGPMPPALFHTQCKNYPFTYDDGGPVRAGGRIYMVDEYGDWVSYLAVARDHAVSNYQFAASNEWFAEAYAAYYNPEKDAASRRRLSPAVRQYFFGRLRAFCGKKPGTGPGSAE